MNENCHFFFHSQSPFSQWHKSKITQTYKRYGQNDAHLSLVFENAEQAMMWGKARVMKDDETAALILKTPNAKDVKALGRMIKNFNQETWDASKYLVVFKVNMLKFSQNPELKRALLDTGDTYLVEASPYDKIWGIGLGEEEARKTPPGDWPGQNLLGHALMEVRDILRNTLDTPSAL